MLESSPGLIDILRSALKRLDDESSGGTVDPIVLAFKQRILRSIAQLELTRNSLQAPDIVIPDTPAASASSSSSLVPQPPAPSSSAASPSARAAATDSVTVLVARRTSCQPLSPRKNPANSTNSATSPPQKVGI